MDDVCVDYGTEGNFSGGACQATQECPWGFSCKPAKSADGIESMQCVADTERAIPGPPYCSCEW
jgi:hypothetical protein